MGGVWLHRIVGFASYVLACFLYVAKAGAELTNIALMVMGFGMSMFGAELPDYDNYKGVRSWRAHRSFVTHTFLIPFALFAVVILLVPFGVRALISPFLVFLLFGQASHLFLDVRPGEKRGKAADWDEESVGKETKKTKGDNDKKTFYCIKYPVKGGSKRASPSTTKFVLVASGGLDLVFGLCALNIIPCLLFA